MKVPRGLRAACLVLVSLAIPAIAASATDSRGADQRLNFQTSSSWSPRINVDADIVMVYGIRPSLSESIASWKKHGYQIHVMTGVAWGDYQNYLDGHFDGKNHWDEAQTDRNGNMVMHGHSKTIPYMSPGVDYGRYLTVAIKQALDAGAEAIYLEEPEFWAHAGYSESFKREWKSYYGETWQAPDGSVDAQYKASKLKYFLYRRALSQVFDFVKQYGDEHGRKIPCYVATHSLLNYAQWRIVSPESSLLSVGTDGYIAQVWTGTARSANVYEGKQKERSFETAFLEYGAMQNLVRASGRRVWYLNDPVEDNPDHSWDDYRSNWESTLVASLLQPDVWRYEIMPWPERVFGPRGLYPALEPAGHERSKEIKRVPISKAYETELQTVIHALGEMKQPATRWITSGTQNVGILVSDTLMFQRSGPTPSDPHLGSFFGLALPLLKHGLPVEPVQVESAINDEFLKHYRMLLLTYEGQKPPTPQFHETLARWVKNGGALVVVDDDRDPYLAVSEWWNRAPLSYRTPRQHLFKLLGLTPDFVGTQRVGKGVVVRDPASPSALTYKKDGADRVRQLSQIAASAIDLPWSETNALVLKRGPYLIAAGLDESVSSPQPTTLNGHFIDLFDPDLKEKESVTAVPGKRLLLFDLDAAPSNVPVIAAASSHIDNEQATATTLTFRSSGIAQTEAFIRIKTTRKPVRVLVNGKELESSAFKVIGQILELHYNNSINPVLVEITFN